MEDGSGDGLLDLKTRGRLPRSSMDLRQLTFPTSLQDLIRAGGADRDADGPEARCAVAGPEAPLSLSFLSVCYYH